MRWQDIKYLLAYIGPISAYIGIYLAGIWSYSAVVIAFLIIPFLELRLKGNGSDQKTVPHQRGTQWIFDGLLYLHIPLLYGLVWYLLSHTSYTEWAVWEVIGMALGVGIYVGASGINVGHELGHRSNKMEQFFAQILLLPSFYMHFFIEHNHGHHRYVATHADPSTARFGESLYAFWLRSTFGSWRSAWQIEKRRLAKEHSAVWSLHNRMLGYLFFQMCYLTLVFYFFGTLGLVLAVTIGMVGFLLLETINYIEHYGLVRMTNERGRPEKVSAKHSWNSNHDIGRIFLYELTRHADHHIKASKKYQELEHIEDSPQLPTGYPGSMLLALFPPIWFRVMNPRIPAYMIKPK